MVNDELLMDNWKEVRLKDIYDDLVMGQSPSSLTYNDEKKGLPFVQGNADMENGFPKIRIYTTDPKKLSQKGDILLSVRAPVGDLFKNNIGEIAIGRGISAIRVKDKFLNNYLFQYFIWDKKQFSKLQQGTTFTEIGKREVRNLLVPIPDNQFEITAIATILSKVDEAIEATRQSIKAAEKLKKALMQNLLTGKLKPDGSWRKDDEFYEDEKFGKVPVGWEVKKLRDVFYVNQKTLPSQTDANYKFRYITIEAVNTENIDFESCPEYEFKNSPGRARRVIENGDILISGVRPNLKAFAIYEKPNSENWICSTGFYVLTAKEEESNKFYFYQILSEIVESQFHSYVAGSNYPAIGDRDIKLMKLYSPPYPEQCLIKKKISFIADDNIQKQTKIRTLQRLKKSLMQNLLTGKIRVNVAMVNDKLSIINEENNG